LIRLLIVSLIMLSAVPQSYAGKVKYDRCHNNLALNAKIITRIQTWLREQGHNPGALDGAIGEGTKRAIKEYRRKNYLGQSDKVDFALLVAALGPKVSISACNSRNNAEFLAFNSRISKPPAILGGPAKVVGPKVCAECHKKEAIIWKTTAHFSTFRDLTQRKRTKEITKKMGIKRVKTQGVCLFCHFTNQLKQRKLQPIAGVSCESCHAPAKDWYKVHSEFSGKTIKTETKSQAKARWARAKKHGMIRPKALYYLAKNCMNCHLTPNEKLVNVGGHVAGSKFDLVSWTQGEMRHNIWHSKNNRPASTKRKRLMYVIGLAVELETAMRAVGRATQKNTYAISMAKRVSVTRKKLKKVARALPKVKELADIIKASGRARLSLENKAALNVAANKVGSAALKIVAKYDGRTFRAIDRWLPNPRSYKGRPFSFRDRAPHPTTPTPPSPTQAPAPARTPVPVPSSPSIEEEGSANFSSGLF